MRTRTGLRDLLSMKTLNSLYLNKQCYSSRYKLRFAKEVTWSLGGLCPCPPHPQLCLTVRPLPTSTPACDPTASAPLLHHAIQRFLSACGCGAGPEWCLQKHLLNAHGLMEYPPINALSPEPGRFSTVALSLDCTLQTLQKSPCIPHYCFY